MKTPPDAPRSAPPAETGRAPAPADSRIAEVSGPSPCDAHTQATQQDLRSHPIGGSLTRRSFLEAGIAAGLSTTWPAAAASAAEPIPFGAAMQSEIAATDAAYVDAFVRECELVVPMNELKFGSLRPSKETFSFDGADRILDLARANGRRSRGHTFVWWNALPDWLQAVDDPAALERELVLQIETVMDRYRGRLDSWDVVNEVIAHDPSQSGPLRDTFWAKRLGPRHIPVAFAAAARADPAARLVLNDYDLEFRGRRYDRRRAIVIALVRQLQDAGIAIHAVGLQAHLYAELSIDVEALAHFVEALKIMGVGVIVTELDVIDWKIKGGAPEQDAAAARIVGDLFDSLLSAGAPQAVVTWGITDRYSWIPDVMPRRDGKPCRPLPLDADLVPKSWYKTLRRRLQV